MIGHRTQPNTESTPLKGKPIALTGGAKGVYSRINPVCSDFRGVESAEMQVGVGHESPPRVSLQYFGFALRWNGVLEKTP